MNWIANARYSLLLVLAGAGGCNLPATESVSAGDSLAYSVHYSVSVRPGADSVDVSMRLRQNRALLRELRFTRTPAISNLRLDGEKFQAGDEVVWQPQPSGGTLSWTVKVAHQRSAGSYDALLTESWGIFRAEDIIPRAATRVQQGAYSKTTLAFDLPTSWSAITGYEATDDGYRVRKADRNFDQPSGWIAIGELGIRRDIIAGVRVAVAAPVGNNVRRMDMLALLNWTLPELSRVLGQLPDRLTIVSAGDPMWRGGLSGPHTLYMHADRPLISENATSTLLHEVMHSVLRQSAAPGYDWIVEGLAEYYSLELLQRSGTISDARYDKAIARQQEWAESADALCGRSSKAETTALAVTVLHALDAELRQRSAGAATLDDVVQRLQQDADNISLQSLRRAAEALAGQPSDVLRLDNLPGCRSIRATSEESS